MNQLDINYEKLTPQQMVDLCGVMAHQEKLLEARRKEIGKKLIELGVLPLDGDAFHGQVVEATTAYQLNRAAVTLEMGQDWVDEHSTRTRAGGIRTR